MTENEKSATRRRVLQTIGAGVTVGTVGVGSASARGNGRGNGNGGGNAGYPPNGITNWGETRPLGNGEISTFTVETPSGEVKEHGLYIDRDALEGLPSGEELKDKEGEYTDPRSDVGESLPIHGKQSLQLFIPLPESDNSHFEFVSLNWNPNGHPMPGVWTVPHFDMHFHRIPMDVVEGIDGPRAPEYEVPAKYIPEGYGRDPMEDMRVITYMGEHLADLQAPELSEGESEFESTFIWGLYDADDDGIGELSFAEPMITLDYLNALDDEDTREIRQPDAYRKEGLYPHEYTARDVPSDDALVVTIGDLQYEGSEGSKDDDAGEEEVEEFERPSNGRGRGRGRGNSSGRGR